MKGKTKKQSPPSEPPTLKSFELLEALPKLITNVTQKTQALQASIDKAGGDLADVDAETLAMWTYAIGSVSGWIMMGGAMAVADAITRKASGA